MLIRKTKLKDALSFDSLNLQHPDVKIKGRTVDMSDIEADPVVQFQRKFYIPLYLFLRILMPLFIPCYYWGEIVHYSVIGLFAQYIGALHATWFVNSGWFKVPIRAPG